MKKWQVIFLLLLIAGTAVIYRQEHPRMGLFQREEGMVFGTVFHTTYECDSSLMPRIMSELQGVDASLSMFNPQSTLSRINRGESQQTDSLLRLIMDISREVSQATDGAFDITVAPLVNAWGFGFKSGEMPDSARVDSLRQLVGWRKVSIDDKGLLHKETDGMVLDCSAVAKGLGVDVVAGLYDRLGIANYMIEIGGEVVVKGRNPKGKTWSIGINKPVEDSTSTNEELQTILEMTDIAMATSGNYRNFYTSGNKKVAHTIDPHTGYPVQRDVVSSTVFGPTCAVADAYATSFMVLGLGEAKKVLAKHPELKAYLIYLDTEGQTQTWHTANLQIPR